MNQSIFSRTYFKFTISLVNSLGIHYFFHDFTIMTPLIVRVFTLNLLFLSRIHYGSINFSRIGSEFTISFANSLSIHYLFRESTINSLSVRELIMNPFSLSEFTLDSLSIWRTISFANSLWIPYLFQEFIINSLSFWRIHYGSNNFSRIGPEFTISFANSLSIHYLFRESTNNTLSVHELIMNPLFFCVSTLNLLSFSRIHYWSFLFQRLHFGFTIYLANYLLREFTMNFLSFSRIHYQFTIFLANSL